MKHTRFDLPQWVERCRLSAAATAGALGTLSGPRAAAYVEQARAAAQAQGADLGRAVPTDLCVWAFGDSDRRDVTKIGGVPFWPAGEPWPELDNGRPFTFVAQISFADSLDILPPLPGDLLSILAADDDYMNLYVAWHHADGCGNLRKADKVPTPRWVVPPLHAQLHRTADYPDADGEPFAALEHPLGGWARVLDGCTKIGGLWLARGDLPAPDEFDAGSDLRRSIEQSWARRRTRERTFVCQLHSVTAWGTWPFVNLEAKTDEPGVRFLPIGDLGGYDFFTDGKETDYAWHG